jgi:hypothetical protein
MAIDDRPTFRLGTWEPPNQYNQPQLEPDGDVRTKEHDVLGDKEVVQVLGENAESFTLRGDGFAEDIKRLREMKTQVVEVRHEIYSGEVLVKGVRANSTGSYETQNNKIKWVYTYTVDLIESVGEGESINEA